MANPITAAVTGATTGIAALSQATTLAGSLTNLLLASPQTTQGYQPQNPPSATGLVSTASPPPSLLFHYEGEQTATLTSDITDHFLEDNTAVQDQISIKPVMITTHGFIGELNNVPPPALAFLQQAANTLTTLSPYTPKLSTTALLAYDTAFAAYQLAQGAFNAGVSAWSSLTSSGGESVINSNGATGFKTQVSNQNKQQTYFQQFYGYWYNRTLFTIQTPWAIFQSMAIQTLRAVQDGETRMITDFEVTFKQINIASTAGGGSLLQGSARNALQGAGVQNAGQGSVSPGPSVPTGVSTQLKGP